MRLVLAGFGVVGQSFARLLMAQEKELALTYGLVPQVVGIMDSSGWLLDEHGVDMKKALKSKKETGRVTAKARREEPQRKASDVIRDLEAEVLVEATPTNFKTGEPGFSHMKAAFESRKHVVTCNKGPLAIAYYALHELARHNGVQLRFSGAVGGGTPVLDFGKTCSMGDELIGIRGILNGTCNYILTKMEWDGLAFDEALEGAQKAGYAEADPSLDIDGYDSAVKLVITANHLLLSKAVIKDVKVRGIRGISTKEVLRAKKDGMAVRLIASVSQERGLTVEPTLIERDHPLCINGANNAVEFECEYSGPKVIIGKGAGGPETASSLLRDLLEIRGRINGSAQAIPNYAMGALSGGWS
ncbi:MAG TPA: homoserine dehydrogenase [Nitrososphaerales archaeon]|nr:homoserine dehydrogenase [Nitrososphaerales archaeon]